MTHPAVIDADGAFGQQPYRTVCLNRIRTHHWVRMVPSALTLTPVDYLAKISNPQVSDETDLGERETELTSAVEVWRKILKSGMNDPLIIIFFSVPSGHTNRTATIRLESGNHRSVSARKSGFTHLPTIAFLQGRPIGIRAMAHTWSRLTVTGSMHGMPRAAVIRASLSPTATRWTFLRFSMA